MNISLVEAAGVSLAAGAAPGKKNAPTEGGLFAALLASLTASTTEGDSTETLAVATVAPETESEVAVDPEAALLVEGTTAAESLVIDSETSVAAEETVETDNDTPPPPANAASLVESPDAIVVVAAAATVTAADTFGTAAPALADTDGEPILRAQAPAMVSTMPKAEAADESVAPAASAPKAIASASEGAPASPPAKADLGAIADAPKTERPVAVALEPPLERATVLEARPASARVNAPQTGSPVAAVETAADADPVPALPVPKTVAPPAAAANKATAAVAVEQTVRVAETAPVPVLRIAASALRSDGKPEAPPETPQQPEKPVGLVTELPEGELAVDDVEIARLPKLVPERVVLAAAEEAAARERTLPELMAARAERPAAPTHTPEPQGITAARGVEAPATAETPQPAAPASRDAMLPERVALHDIGRAAAGGVRQLAVQGGGSLVIRVAPESLGDLRIEVRREDGQVTVKVTASNQAVREALETGAHGLREVLAREGVELKQMQVSAPPSGGQPQTQQQSQQHTQDPAGQRGTGGGYRPQPDTPSRQESYPSGQGERAPRPTHQGALNVWA